MKRKLFTGCLAILFILFLAVGAGAADDEAKLNLNAATVEELSKIPGLNEELVKKIMDFRNSNGEFIDMEELLEIPGIDNALFQKLKEHLFIEAVDNCYNC